MIDVPGYGYANVDKKTQAKFGMMIEEYLEKRHQLKRVFLLIDFRHKPMEDDLLMYNFLKYYNLPVTIIATKADKVGGSKKQKNLAGKDEIFNNFYKNKLFLTYIPIEELRNV